MTEEVKSDEDSTEEELEAKYGDPSELEESEASDESPDTPPETVDDSEAKADDESPDTKEDTAEKSQEEVDTVKEAFQTLGLGTTYADPEAALKGAVEMRTEIGRLQRELGTAKGIKELLERPAPAPPPQPVVEEVFNRNTYDDLLQTNPVGAQKYVNRFTGNELKETVSKLQDQLTASETARKEDLVRVQAKEQLDAYNVFKEKHSDFDSKETEIVRLLQDDPMLNQISGVNPVWAIQTAYKLVSAGKMPQELTNGDAPTAVSKSKLAKATTSSGGQSRKTSRSADNYTDTELANMTEKELEKLFPSVE